VPAEIERLYREHRAGLVRLVARELRDPLDAEDVVQTAFLDAQRALESGTIPRNPPAWLAAIALNAARRLRRRRLNAEPLEEYAVQEASRMPEIREALRSLPREQRVAVLYRDVLGLSYGETAEQMGTSVNAVTMLLHRGRQRLRQTLGVTVGGVGLWRWLKRAGMPQAAVAKGAAAVVVAAGLATGGIAAARVVARARTHLPVALTMRSGSLAAGPRLPHGRALAPGSARRGRLRRAAGPRATVAAEQTETSSGETTSAQSPPPSVLPVPTASVPTLPIPTSPLTVTATTPITTATATVPAGTTATVTTPIVTVTVPVP
jgi:RNA polymerase sigma-70 factor (ECF subfamily)